jgi:ABC-type transporter Mla MlaB component
MAEQSKDSEGFFRKVARFVANPATDWADLNAVQDGLREAELEKSELKAMVARKRRNDFVRKREFDMLRKVRREGLTPDQLAALGSSSSPPDDSEVRLSDSAVKQDGDVKDKIDAIEKQMVGDGLAAGARARPPSAYAPTEPVRLAPEGGPPRGPVPDLNDVVATQQLPPRGGPMDSFDAPMAVPAAPAGAMPADLDQAFSVEVNEVVHDPELDEAVIAFANADFDLCEQSLGRLTGHRGPRAQHAETWLVRFDLYRAIGEQAKFEALAGDYAQQFGWSAPQWFSMPRMVAEAAAAEEETHQSPRASQASSAAVGWSCPGELDEDAAIRLQAQLLQMPQPWVLDFSALERIEPQACTRLSEVLRHWMGQAVDMRWIGGEKLFTVLADAAPTGVRDADPAYWALRLDALRAANRPDQFDEVAIDYCVTYEVSPPSWERPRCTVRISGAGLSTQSPPLSVVGDVSTYIEPTVPGATSVHAVASVELAGQLIGDIHGTLERLERQVLSAPHVNVSCARLIRVDFVAAGDLLNWVLKQRGEGRSVAFVDAHRLLALFFGAMGINEHAKVKVRVN